MNVCNVFFELEKIVFLDPPYKMLGYANPLKVIFKREVLADDGMIVLERPSRQDFDGKYFEHYKTNRLGQKSLDFFRHFKKESKDEV